MKEIELNTILVKSIKLGEGGPNKGFGFKLKDPGYQELMRGTGKNPHDSYGCLSDGRPIFLEAKLVKPQTTATYSSFNFNKIEEHQIEALTTLVDIRKRNDRDTIIVYPIAVYRPRKIFEVYFFDADYIHTLIDSGKKSILGSDFQKLHDEGKFLPISKKYVDINRIDEVLIK